VTFKLHARVSRSDAKTIRQILADLAAKANIAQEGDELTINADLDGESAKT